MEKADRDQTQAIRAEDECRQLIAQFPNSKYVDETKQLLRNIQEAIAEGEYWWAISITSAATIPPPPTA